jgi:hypothetical protein
MTSATASRDARRPIEQLDTPQAITSARHPLVAEFIGR